jgi:hypothetical protein
MSSRKTGIVFALASLLIIVSFVNAHGQNPATTVAIHTWGNTEVKFNTATDFIRLVEGTRLGAGDTIQTGDKGKVELALSDKSKIVIGANSQVVIKELGMVEVTRVTTSTFELVKGKIRAIVVPFVDKDSQFKVETGNATVGVRGTDFGVTRDPDADTTRLLTIEGTVYLMLTYFPHLPPIWVAGGEEITVTGDKQPPKPSKTSWKTTYQFLQEMMTSPHEGKGDHGGGNKGGHGGASETT